MWELVADALPSQKKTLRINNDFNIDLEVLKNVEKDLEDYEKLSLLFLILEDYNCFQQIYRAFHGHNDVYILSEFVGGIQEWQTKFFEALCLTKAKREIRMLGKSFDELETIYVPVAMITDPRVPHGNKVHPGAKLLFHLFDHVLGEDERKLLLESIYKDIERPGGFNDDDGMEMHALWWVENGFITLASDGYGDFQKLLKHLKKIGLCERPTYSDMEKYTVNSRDKIQNPPRLNSKRVQSHVLTQNITNNSTKPSVLSDTMKNPYIIIINIITVPYSGYEDRDSSNVDVLKLKSTFHGLGHTSCNIYNECTEDEIKKIFQDVKNNFDPKKFDALIVCILSHGVKGHFVSHDDVEMPLVKIEGYMCIPELQGVPKIVMVQACQGNIIPKAIETIKKSNLVADGLRDKQEDNRCINTSDHVQFLMFSSTMRECRAIRHKEDGSWFIEAVCEVLRGNREGNAPLSVHEWTQRVKNIVKDNRGELEKGVIAAQLPEVLNDRFDRCFYFPKYRGDRL